MVDGELIVQNGKHAGTKVPLVAPVMVIGQAEQCDARLMGQGVGPVHCFVTLTPDGPALRSWYPDETLVNGTPTAAALLKNGDDLKVGPCVFRVAWYADALVSLVPVPPPAPPVVQQPLETGPATYDLSERVGPSSEEVAKLAALLASRRQHVATLFEELAAQREELRQHRAKEKAATAADRAEAKQMRIQLDRMRHAARAQRIRAKKVYARFLRRLKARWATERLAVAAEREGVDAVRRRLTDEMARFEADREQVAATAGSYREQLQSAWEMVTKGRTQLAQERSETMAALESERERLTAQAADLAAREENLEVIRLEVTTRSERILGEITRLETRAANARAVVRQLETEREALEAGGVAATVTQGVSLLPVEAERVPLTGPMTRGTDEFLTDLMTQQRDLDRERHGFARVRQELERRAADLHDQRMVVAEQMAAIAVARQLWQTAEYRAVDELETLARGLDVRERDLNAQSGELARTDATRQRREKELQELREKLETWQTELTDRVQQAIADRELQRVELATKREHLTKWEASLDKLCRKWSAAREQEAVLLQGELSQWFATRARSQARLAELDQTRDQLLADATRVAAQSIAVEQVQQEMSTGSRGPLAVRRLRVLRKHWEKQFTRARRDIDARRAALANELSAAEVRYRDLTRVLTEAVTQRAAVAEAEQFAEAARAVKERELEDRAVILSLEAERARRAGEPVMLRLVKPEDSGIAGVIELRRAG
ncbi:Chromosome partition protein smc [Fimbriiglobus ruber]|uniref:Chromosome partition protein smc n=2 Tax=Fimbriiglobus ruber TaxID=1908690 RepID=A0A225DTG6_9BACT|nr:Chromosome partition protein smc [Fimbriiglobus ruber]